MTIAHRSFIDYETYVHRQGEKARDSPEKLMRHIARSTDSFTSLFRDAAPHLNAGPVLCLGARTGAESLGAAAAGFTGSVGVDLHPVGPTVVKGDWHNLPFNDGLFANAYSNSLDHCLHLDLMAAEVHRVLGTGGRFYVMATNRPNKTAESWLSISNSNEALYWDTSADLSAAICAFGFTEIRSWHTGKWGHHILGRNQ